VFGHPLGAVELVQAVDADEQNVVRAVSIALIRKDNWATWKQRTNQGDCRQQWRVNWRTF
jgi:hypothetical protein